jgi:hypothetical protein
MLTCMFGRITPSLQVAKLAAGREPPDLSEPRGLLQDVRTNLQQLSEVLVR